MHNAIKLAEGTGKVPDSFVKAWAVTEPEAEQLSDRLKNDRMEERVFAKLESFLRGRKR